MDLKTPISLLQEYLVKDRVLPSYKYIYREGADHDPIFHCEVTAKGIREIGKGRTKKDAKHDAAMLLLLRLKGAEIWKKEVPIISYRTSSSKKNWIGALQEYCVEYYNLLPQYVFFEIRDARDGNKFGARCTFSSVSKVGRAPSKKAAKQYAAQKVFLELKNANKNRTIEITEDALPQKTYSNTRQSFQNSWHGKRDRAHTSSKTLRVLYVTLPEDLLEMIVEKLGDKLVQAMMKGEKRTEKLKAELERLAELHNQMIDDFSAKAKEFKIPPEHLRYDYFQPVVKDIISEQMIGEIHKFSIQ